jgi:hypothetical protein
MARVAWARDGRARLPPRATETTDAPAIPANQHRAFPAADALDGVHQRYFSSSNALSKFPRTVTVDG